MTRKKKIIKLIKNLSRILINDFFIFNEYNVVVDDHHQSVYVRRSYCIFAKEGHNKVVCVLKESNKKKKR
jgi:hypothetical protein